MENIEFTKIQSAEELKDFCLYPEEELKKQPYFMVVHKFTIKKWEKAYLHAHKMGWPVFIKFDTATERKAYEHYIDAVYKKLGM